MGQAPRDILRRHGIRADKALGQHFLALSDVAERQVDYANVVEDDVVLEVGPGLGTLTRAIARKGCRVIAVEKDPTMVHVLRKDLLLPNVELLEGDILDMDLEGLGFNKVISNIPYNISSELTLTLVRSNFEVAVIMYQLEFAERLTARPCTKAYSRLTLGVLVRADTEMLEKVPATAFHPMPEVDSAIVRIRPSERKALVTDLDLFDEVLDTLFSQRRKKIRNTLSSWTQRLLGMKGPVDLSNVPYGDRRPEELSLEQVAELVKHLSKMRDQTDGHDNGKRKGSR